MERLKNSGKSDWKTTNSTSSTNSTNDYAVVYKSLARYLDNHAEYLCPLIWNNLPECIRAAAAELSSDTPLGATC